MTKILDNKPKFFILLPIFIILLTYILNSQPSYPVYGIWGLKKLMNVVLYNFGYIVYMNLGVLVYLSYTKKISLFEIIYLVCISLIVALYFLYNCYNKNLIIVYLYLSGFCIFILFYKFRLTPQGIFPTFFAKISFPLYAIHSTLGFVLLSIFIYKLKLDAILSFILVVVIIIYISWLIHQYIELPALRKSKNIR